MKLTAERLRELFRYDPETGQFTRRVAIGRHGCFVAGSVAGSLKKCGYIYVCVDHISHRAHRLAWLYVTGHWPADQIDHMDGDRTNNRIANLREATNAENRQNERKARRSSKSGLLGVTASGRRWRACIKLDGRTRQLGRFSTPEAAHMAYLAAKAELHPFGTLRA